MNKSIRIIVAISFFLPFFATGQALLGTETKDAAFQLQKFTQFYRNLSGNYIDTINNERLIEDAIKKILSELDPHSAYLSAEEMKPVAESFSGSFSGIGIEFNVLRDTIIVVNTIPGGPSEKVGLQPNDRIVTADGHSVVGTPQKGVPKILRGPKGTRIEVGVIRRGVPEVLIFRIVRDNIPIHTVDAAYKLDSRTGYIKVNRFAQNTMKEFTDAFAKFGKVDALILDLRGNGGGYLNQAILMSNFFLKRGSLITSTEGLRQSEERFNATVNGVFQKGKLVVLVDEGSASGSEIVAGAVQDWDRGVLIGRRTFGKGLVQREFRMIDGSAVRITVARYHTPTGRVIQRPFTAGDTEGYYKDFIKRVGNDADSLNTDGEQELFRTLRAGRTVYGGGGIYPDIYMSDTTIYSVYWSRLVRMGVINEFTVRYLDQHRNEIMDAFPVFERYNETFGITDAILEELTEWGVQRGVERDSVGLSVSSDMIRIQLKALFAQKLWTMTEYYRVMNGHDPVFGRAVEILRDWKTSPVVRGISDM